MFNENSVCHACSDAFSMFNEVQLPCLMHYTSIGACWYANANVNWKMLYCQRICWNAFAMFTEMQLPCLLKMQLLCLLKCRCHVLCTVLPLGENIGVEMTMASWKCSTVAMFSVLQLPCLMYCSCHVWCTTVAMFSVLCLPCSVYYVCHIQTKI